ncbi:AAA family ATPase [Bradyrhizobium sp. Gha]|uniref:AAA family ATPase n=1 Tax=Bradyrhizobium sp. Gha TaxID=1855318 RepID=UPI001FCDEF1A|nr:AAA family ATPase [Bradyrhizobium sp. Gha]
MTQPETLHQRQSSNGVADLISFARRQSTIILGVMLACLAGGVLYLINTPPSFTAQATMIIDTRKNNVFQQQLIGDSPVDSSMVESQVEVLRSENIASAVIKQLRLTDDPEFVGPGGGLLGGLVSTVSGLLESDAPQSQTGLNRRAVEAFANRLSVKRVGLTYIIEIAFTSNNPAKAAQIANAVADAYINDQLNAKYQATQRASIWLQDRIGELRKQSSTAERAVVDFRTKNNLVNTGGRLMNEQQLSELNTQLILSRGLTAEAKARLDRINDIVKAEPDATVTDTLKNEVITKLRQQYLELKAREAEWSERYGAQHQATIQLRSQMQELRRSIGDELQRIAQTYKSDYEIAKQREQALERGLNEAVSDSQVTDQAQVSLRDLESSAQTYRTLYNNFLQRYTESVQQQSFPITEARVITAASPPLTKSKPKGTLTLLVASFLGLGLGFLVGRLRDLSDRSFRTTDQVESVLGVNCIGILPLLKPAAVPDTSVPVPSGAGASRVLNHNAEVFSEVVNGPFSRFTEGVRAIKVASDLANIDRPKKVVAVTSTLPNEGKSTIAASLAELISQSGARVVLIDADLRNPSLTRRLAPHATIGLLELARGSNTLSDVVWTEPVTKLDFLPSVVDSKVAHTNEILSSPSMGMLFERLKSVYDYIIVDLSPIAPVVDVRTTAGLIDSYLYVVEWGRTRVDAVAHALTDAKNVHEKLVGVILNKANIATLSRYESYKGSYYHNKYYSRYRDER